MKQAAFHACTARQEPRPPIFNRLVGDWIFTRIRRRDKATKKPARSDTEKASYAASLSPNGNGNLGRLGVGQRISCRQRRARSNRHVPRFGNATQFAAMSFK